MVLHSDHCAAKLLQWFDGMLEADEAYFKEHQEPLFSSHMLDLSEESKEENIATCAKYFKRMAAINLWLEMEIGITGGEEDGVDNTGVDNASLYTQPEDVWDVYDTLSKIRPNFSIAAAFGNVHGVYKPGNVKLQPDLLGKHRKYIAWTVVDVWVKLGGLGRRIEGGGSFFISLVEVPETRWPMLMVSRCDECCSSRKKYQILVTLYHSILTVER